MEFTMRTALPILLSTLVAAAGLSTAGVARAEEGFDVKVTPGHLSVTPKKGWHINLAYPWKLTIGDTKIDKGKFQLSEGSASVEAPKGAGKLKGAVCQGESQCKMFEQAVTIP
jgi:hypothetical protein